MYKYKSDTTPEAPKLFQANISQERIACAALQQLQSSVTHSTHILVRFTQRLGSTQTGRRGSIKNLTFCYVIIVFFVFGFSENVFLFVYEAQNSNIRPDHQQRTGETNELHLPVKEIWCPQILLIYQNLLDSLKLSISGCNLCGFLLNLFGSC